MDCINYFDKPDNTVKVYKNEDYYFFGSKTAENLLDTEFTFEIQLLNDEDKEVNVSDIQYQIFNDKSSETEQKNRLKFQGTKNADGTYDYKTFTLKSNQHIEFYGLGKNDMVIIREILKNGDTVLYPNYSAVETDSIKRKNHDICMEGSAIVSAKTNYNFKNIPNVLLFRKQIIGAGEDELNIEEEFTFQIKDYEENPANLKYYLRTSDNEDFGGDALGGYYSTGTSGTFTLKHGQTAMFIDPVAGMEYTITEAVYDPSVYTPTANSVKVTARERILDNADSNVTITNSVRSFTNKYEPKNGLYVYKSVKDRDGRANPKAEYQFIPLKKTTENNTTAYTPVNEVTELEYCFDIEKIAYLDKNIHGNSSDTAQRFVFKVERFEESQKEEAINGTAEPTNVFYVDLSCSDKMTYNLNDKKWYIVSNNAEYIDANDKCNFVMFSVSDLE